MKNQNAIELTLGERLRRYRQRSQYGIKSVASSLEVTHGYLSKIENNKKAPSRGLIIRLCQHYKCSKSETDDILILSDGMLALTGSLPSDIKNIVKTHGDEVFSLIRNTYSDKDNGGQNGS